ncbi:MAG: hypothetical protein HOP10_02260 [Chitinophagaceae bacterium]|nr:hypothetical protein [Chitinophagaceae bacterium]
MKSIKKVRSTPQDINTVIHSFEHYALADIRHSKPKPIAAFILSICFIEQLSTFLYEFQADDSKKPERFFIDYMEEYKDIDLYHKARHTLVHNYSSRGQFDIDKIGFENIPYSIIDNVIHINTNVFIHYLEIAFDKAKKDLLKIDSPQYKNALENSMYYPVLVDTRK